MKAGDLILAVNGVEVKSASQFRRELEKVSPASEVRLRLERGIPVSRQDADTRNTAELLNALAAFLYVAPGIGGGVVETVTLRAGSYAEWAPPLDWFRPPHAGVAPDEGINASGGPTKLEQFVEEHLNRQGLKESIEALRRHLTGTIERFYGGSMLYRVASGYHRPTRLAELQVSITEPLARIVDERSGPWGVPRLILAEAAKNLDVSWSPQSEDEIDLSKPHLALRALARRVRRAQAQLRQAFGKFDAAQRAEMAASLPAMAASDVGAWNNRPSIRTAQAAMGVQLAALFAAADEVGGWRSVGAPPAAGLPAVLLPAELAGAVKGDVLAVEQIGGRWYVYGGHGRNEYDLSRLDVVIDAGGNDLYRYPRAERSTAQLVVDWAGNDVYAGENGVPGPASALLGVSVLVDHQGDDRYEGGNRSCGAGVMGIGLLIDHSGNDSYQGKDRSLGAGFYGFGAIVDLESGGHARPGLDQYTAEMYSQGSGGPRGFGLILDEKGNDRYTAYNPVTMSRGAPTRSQGVGAGVFHPPAGGFETGGIGVLCDLAGDDQYQVTSQGQGAGIFFGLGILYDRAGNDLYSGGGFTQAAAIHGGIGILADDSGNDGYWATSRSQSTAKDHGITLLLDRAGNDSYVAPAGAAFADDQSISWLLDLEGEDRYFTERNWVAGPAPTTVEAEIAQARARFSGQGESGESLYNFRDCECFNFSLFLDAGGSADVYSGRARSDGMVKATSFYNEKKPQFSTQHGLFIDTREKIAFWP